MRDTAGSPSPMRRLGGLVAGGGLLFQRKEAIRQRIQLPLKPVDHLPLLGDLAGQFLDGLLLFGRSNFERREPVVGAVMSEILLQNLEPGGRNATKSRQSVNIAPGATWEIDKRQAICRE